MLPVELIITDEGAEFRCEPDQRGRIIAIGVAVADRPGLADYFAEQFGLPGTGSVSERLVAALEAMAGRGEIKPAAYGNANPIERHCDQAGVGHEFRFFDNGRWATLRRTVPLFRSTEPNGFLRVLSVTLHAEREGDESDYAILLEEQFSAPGKDGWAYKAHLGYRAFEPVADMLEERLGLPSAGDLGERAAAAILTALVARGELGPHLEPKGNRERFIAWCAEAGAMATRDSTFRRHEILRVDRQVLEVVFWEGWRPPEIWFIEAYRAGRDRHGGTEYKVTVPAEALPVLVERFEERLGSEPAAGRLEDRLIGCFAAMAAQGVLRPELPQRANRALVAEWIEAAGVTPTLQGFARTEPLLKVHRRSTDCIYELVLGMDAAATGDDGITFKEKYEYLPRPGDAGREYMYSVATPYASLPVLVAHLEKSPGEGDLEERLARCFQGLVARGDLNADLGTQAARDRVASWFAEAGVPAIPGSSSWINSD